MASSERLVALVSGLWLVAGCSAGTETSGGTSVANASANGAGGSDSGSGAGNGVGGFVPGNGGGGSSPGACTPGSTEACYTGPAGTEDVGVCAGGTRTCEGNGEFGTWGPCQGEVLPGEEVCEPAGLDEDCDGDIDEDCNCTPTNPCDPCMGALVWQESFETTSAPIEGVAPPGMVGSFTVTSGDVDAMKAPSGMLTPSHSGAIGIDLNGWSPGTITTTVATVPAASYTLAFAYTKNPSPEVSWPISGKVKIDGSDMLTLQPTVANTYMNLMWTCAAVNFTATSSSTTITLESGNPNNGGLYLDSFTLRKP